MIFGIRQLNLEGKISSRCNGASRMKRFNFRSALHLFSLWHSHTKVGFFFKKQTKQEARYDVIKIVTSSIRFLATFCSICRKESKKLWTLVNRERRSCEHVRNRWKVSDRRSVTFESLNYLTTLINDRPYDFKLV